MTELKFLDAIGKIDMDLLEEADIDTDRKPLKKSKISSKKIFMAGSAAAAVIITGTAVFLFPKDNPDIINNSSSPVPSDTATQTSDDTEPIQNSAVVSKEKKTEKAVTSVYKDENDDKNDINTVSGNITANGNVTSDSMKQNISKPKSKNESVTASKTPDTTQKQQTSKQENPAVVNAKDDICLREEDEEIVSYKNKTVLYGLKDALEKYPNEKVINIIARPYIDYDFEYNGKTLNDYYCDLCEERMLPEKLGQLIKEGDSLKYGTMLYEGGTPDGEKWAKELYDERIAFYGKDFLSKYIVNGEFLRDKVSADLDASYSQTKAKDEYNEAFNSYYQYLADNIKSSLPSGVKENEGIILHMTAEEFKNFTPENLEAWTFTLELKSRDDCCLISYDC